VAKPQATAALSLPDVHGSVQTSAPSLWKRVFAFAGPAYLVSVGYMDPGNWATDLEGGARFGYKLLWVLVLSNLMAILLQTLSARLGIVAGRDLAQACRHAYPRWISLPLWVLCEIAIAACDLAEILGAAIAFKLLFGIPLLAGVLITAFDTLLVLGLMRMGIRKLEAFVLGLVTVVAGCFVVELWLAKPVLSQIATGLIPRIDSQSLYAAIGILGATVMPHNLYLHSALVQTRHIGVTEEQKRAACRFNFIDSVIALNGALLVNASILILAATVFFSRQIEVTRIEQAHEMLSPLVGASMASVLFGVALLAAGQSSTITGTLAGQIVMEGFLNLRMQPWMRRLLTRLLAIIPAVWVIVSTGEEGTYKLLILSQIILSLQLPFAIIPLIRFTSDRKWMGEAFASRPWVKTLAWCAAAIIIGLNLWLAWGFLSEVSGIWWLILGPALAGIGALLVYVAAEPWLPASIRRTSSEEEVDFVAPVIPPAPVYSRILVPLDHTPRDAEALSHATSLAKAHAATIHLLHVEEGVTSQIYGAEASSAEITRGKQYFESIRTSVGNFGIAVHLQVVHARSPREAILAYVEEWRPDLIVMGAHGHQGLRDLVFGTTINAVRHGTKVPVLIVGNPGRNTA
jgi:manganese transport protein